MNGNEIISYAELATWLESAHSDDEFKGCAELLTRAISDWPATAPIEPIDFLEELEHATGKPLTLGNINAYLNALDFRTAGDSARMESVASLLDMFDAYLAEREITLETILANLTKHCRRKTGA
jgi:hypothetical protein